MAYWVFGILLFVALGGVAYVILFLIRFYRASFPRDEDAKRSK